MLIFLSFLNPSSPNLQEIHPPSEVYLPLKFHHDPPTGRVTVHYQDFFFLGLWRINITKIDLCFSYSHLSTNLHQICREYIPQVVLLVPEVSSWSSNWTGHCAPSRLLFEAYGILTLHLLHAFRRRYTKRRILLMANNWYLVSIDVKACLCLMQLALQLIAPASPRVVLPANSKNVQTTHDLRATV